MTKPKESDAARRLISGIVHGEVSADDIDIDLLTPDVLTEIERDLKTRNVVYQHMLINASILSVKVLLEMIQNTELSPRLKISAAQIVIGSHAKHGTRPVESAASVLRRALEGVGAGGQALDSLSDAELEARARALLSGSFH